MKVTKTETHTVEETVITDILCNRCGQSCKDPGGYNHEGLLEAKIRGGYASRLGDMVTWEFSLCEPCLEELFKGFKIPPQNDGDEDFAVRFLERRHGR